MLVRFNPPLPLRELLAGGLDEAQALRKLSRVLRVHFRRQRQMAIGPDLSHRNTQVETLLVLLFPALLVELGLQVVFRLVDFFILSPTHAPPHLLLLARAATLETQVPRRLWILLMVAATV